MCMLWGIVVAMHAACHNFASLAIVRFLLGAIEVCTAPAVIYITGSCKCCFSSLTCLTCAILEPHCHQTSTLAPGFCNPASWRLTIKVYTKDEQVVRVAIWYTTSGWASVFGGFFAWAIYHAKSFRWQSLFVLYGSLTFCVGVILFFALAASPTDAKWLTEEEKAIALERVRENKTGTEVWRFKPSQLKEAFCDVRLYIVFLLLISTGLPNGGLTAFGKLKLRNHIFCGLSIWLTSPGPTIIAGFGFDTKQTTLLNMGSGACTVVGTGVALVVAKHTSRTIAGIYTLTVSCVGVIMMFTIPSHQYAARYGGYVLTSQCEIHTSSLYRIYANMFVRSRNLCSFYYNFYHSRCRWLYQEICLWGCLPTWICCWQYHWSPDI